MNSTYTRRYYAAFTATINFSTSLYFTSAVVTVLSSQMSVSSSAYRTDCNQPSTSITSQSLPSAAACLSPFPSLILPLFIWVWEQLLYTVSAWTRVSPVNSMHGNVGKEWQSVRIILLLNFTSRLQIAVHLSYRKQHSPLATTLRVEQLYSGTN